MPYDRRRSIVASRQERTCCGPLPGGRSREPEAAPADKLACLPALERKVLWLSTWMIHNANHLRPEPRRAQGRRPPGVERLGRDLMTALYLDVLRPQDRVAVKPHASPVFHALQYLLGPPEPRQARALPRVRRRAVLSVAHQGRRHRRFLDRLGRARRRDDAVRLAGAGLSAAASAWCRPTSRPAG